MFDFFPERLPQTLNPKVKGFRVQGLLDFDWICRLGRPGPKPCQAKPHQSKTRKTTKPSQAKPHLGIGNLSVGSAVVSSFRCRLTWLVWAWLGLACRLDCGHRGSHYSQRREMLIVLKGRWGRAAKHTQRTILHH